MPPRFSISYLDPPAALRQHVLVLFYFTWDEPVIVDRHPGALSQLVMLPYADGALEFEGGVQQAEPGPYMLAGFTRAAPIRMRGPWHAVGASLSPLGWAALTGRPVNPYLDRLIPAAELLGRDIDDFAGSACSRYRRGDLTGKEAAYLLAEWISVRLGRVPAAHREVIERTLEWLGGSLSPPVEGLFAAMPYSRRQTERLVERYFGFPPAALARKYRAIRAAALLGEADLPDQSVADIAEAFYDQPHMVREIARYCGYTPSRLGGPSDKLFQQLLRMKNFELLHRHPLDPGE